MQFSSNCLIAFVFLLQSHVFANVGQFLVTVNASNALGTLQDSIFVVSVANSREGL